MRLEAVECLSLTSGRDNEDRAGRAGTLAWVIDGATDVLAAPLTRGGTDAAWFAEAMHRALEEMAAGAPPSLAAVPQRVAETLAPAFTMAACRPPQGRNEHPSAAATIVRAHPNGDLEHVGLGDCVLIAETTSGLARIGIDEAEAGDVWVAQALAASAEPIDEDEPKKDPMTRADLWPRLAAQRARMNTDGGYGIFSITPPPPGLIRHGTLQCRPGARILLATDGLTRLVEVFRRYDAASLFAAAWTHGLASLVAELRALENADADCRRHPRAKISDDATGLLLRLTPDEPAR